MIPSSRPCRSVAAVIAVGLTALVATESLAQRTDGAPPRPANREVYLDRQGVIRWRDDRREVSLFGANYVVTTASDYRAAGYLGADRKRMIDEDMAHFARMGWDGIRLTFWGDWESADSAGNLIADDHLDLLDYLIARARERGIYMLFSPIQLYSSNWPDAMEMDPETPGFGRYFGKARMGTDTSAIRAQVNYLRQILNHVNPYTGVALKNEPAILFIELVNEPWHHPEDLVGSVRYINALTDAVRSTGCRKLVFYNVSQDFRIGEAIRRSKAQGITFGWYPTGLNSGRELAGNYLRGVDAFPDLMRPELARLPRIVYEFDTPDLREATMYPAMTRTFRAVGAQFAALFAYDMQGTASRNLGWQTHYLSLTYTPRKAMSAVIAAEAMRRLPLYGSYGRYPENTRFGDFRISYEENLSELVAPDAFLYAGSTSSRPPDAGALRRVAGYGSSPLVSYAGEGAYFLDKVRQGFWRLEVYPDAVPVRDPFEPQSPGKIVTRAISREWPMTISLPDLGASYSIQGISAGNVYTGTATDGRSPIRPGVYVLSASGPVDVAALPSYLGYLGFREYHPPPADTVAPAVISLARPAYLAGRPVKVPVRVADEASPDSVVLYVRPVAAGFYRGFGMRPDGGHCYSVMLPADALAEGPHEFVVTLFRKRSALTFPGGHPQKPTDWDYYHRQAWTLDVVGPEKPLTLFDAGSDAGRLFFSRIGDAGRRGLFRVGLSGATGRPTFRLSYPEHASGPDGNDYTASLVIADRIRAREEAINRADAVRLRLRGLEPGQTLHVTLMEDDGTSWTRALPVDSAWREIDLPISTFTAGRGVLLPQGFPGEWNYWVEPATGRGGANDRPRLEHLERLQLSLRGEGGVEVESVTLVFP